MRFAEAEVQHMLAKDQAAHAEREAAIARHASDAMAGRSFRRWAGEAIIRFGVRLAGEHAGFGEQRRLVSRSL